MKTSLPITGRAIARGSQNHNNRESAIVLLRFLLEPLCLTRGPTAMFFCSWPFGQELNPGQSETIDYGDGRPGGLTGAGQQSTGQTSWLAGN